jgi:hypothetical protein
LEFDHSHSNYYLIEFELHFEATDGHNFADFVIEAEFKSVEFDFVVDIEFVDYFVN